MRKLKRYYKHKLILYFDENFPRQIIENVKKIKRWQKKCKIFSAYDFDHSNRDDPFHFHFCIKQKYTLVTLDKGFWNDKLYPILKTHGIIIVDAGKNDSTKIEKSLEILISFLGYFPFPRVFVGASKFRISEKGCILKGGDFQTGEIKTMTILPGDTTDKVRTKFGYF